MIQVEQLSKQYGNFTAVNNITFSVDPGLCFGILGPNGAGKTTTIQILTCLSEPTSGSVTILGEKSSLSNRIIKQQIGVVHQNENLDTDFNTYQNLIVHGRYYLMKKKEIINRANYLIETFDLKMQKEVPVQALSGGMKRRLQIAKALINNPQVVFLDEPTTGLDPHARIQVWELIKLLKEEKKTIIISSHYMDEIERLCDQVILMQNGKILENGNPKELIQNKLGNTILEVQLTKESDSMFTYLTKNNISFEKYGSKIHIYNHDLNTTYLNLSQLINPKYLYLRPSNLEDYYLSVSKVENEY